MAPEVGLEPTTSRLTAARSTIELLWILKNTTYKCPPLPSMTEINPAANQPGFSGADVQAMTGAILDDPAAKS